jgi:hypothetical protein
MILLSFHNKPEVIVRVPMRMMNVMLLLDPKFWRIPTWPKQVVSSYSVYVSSCLPDILGKHTYPNDLADAINQPDFTQLIQQFIYDESGSHSDSETSSAPQDLPTFYEKITVFTSAVATFCAPSDISGIGGMRCEHIHAVDTWRNGPGRYDCIFVSTDPSAEGMRGFDIARVRLLFSFKHEGAKYPCALIHWYSRIGDSVDENTGMWTVKPDILEDGSPFASVIHLNTIFRAAHLLPVYGDEFVPTYLSFTQSLDAFNAYYVNKYIDHHAFEIAF